MVGTGTLTIAVGGASTSITIDSTDNTLAGIAAAINGAEQSRRHRQHHHRDRRVRGWCLPAPTTGAANAITVTQSGGDGGLSSLGYDSERHHNLTRRRRAGREFLDQRLCGDQRQQSW